MILLLLLAVLVIAGVAGAVLGARYAARRLEGHYARSNEVVPGIPSGAPTSWLGSHEPEAKLHRRLIAAVGALHAAQDLDVVGTHLDLRIEIEQRAVELDNELVVTANLPMHLRDEPLERLTDAVALIEAAVAEVNLRIASGGTEGLERLLADIRERGTTLDRARAALREVEDASEVDGTEESSDDERPSPATDESGGGSAGD